MTNKEKNIQTHKANLNLVKKFLDCANVADASYALLEYVEKDKLINKDKNDYGDGLKFGDKFNGENSTYARAIEARFNKNKIVGKESILCFPFTELCVLKDKTIDNDISKVGLEDKLSDRTIKFVNRYELLEHETNQGKFFR